MNLEVAIAATMRAVPTLSESSQCSVSENEACRDVDRCAHASGRNTLRAKEALTIALKLHASVEKETNEEADFDRYRAESSSHAQPADSCN